MIKDQPTFLELWSDRYDTLNESGKVHFLMNLKREWMQQGSLDAGTAFNVLCKRWMADPYKE